MNQFIACICYSDLSKLVVEGEATAEQIAESWANIFYEYCDRIDAVETRYRVRLVAEISFEKKKNELVNNWIKILELSYSEKIVNALHILDFDFELNPEDPEQYYSDLKTIQAQLNLSKLHVRIKEAEYAAIQENQSTTEIVDETYFKKMFFRINNYAKREAVNGMTTVEDYCVALKDYVDFVINAKN